jgi:Tfp pilus assembly PilM family ATPase
MPNLPIIAPLWNYLAAPSYPRTAVSISETAMTLVTLRRTRREFEPKHLALVRLPAGLVEASYEKPNLSDESALATLAERLMAEAGVKRLRRLTVALPEGSAHSLVVTLDAVPRARQELVQMLDWKIERSFGGSASDMRLSYQRLRSINGQSSWLATSVRREVIEQFEDFFARMGWQVGLVLPAHLAEAQWVMRSAGDEDQALVSLNERGFVAVITRRGEPILIREVLCQPSEREDELHRLMIYYRDRLISPDSPAILNRLLVIGAPEEQAGLRRTITDALESPVAALDPGQVGLRLSGPSPFAPLAAAAGLSTFGWAR